MFTLNLTETLRTSIRNLQHTQNTNLHLRYSTLLTKQFLIGLLYCLYFNLIFIYRNGNRWYYYYPIFEQCFLFGVTRQHHSFNPILLVP